MMRVCHLNTCPVGIATQDPELRAPLRRHARAGRHLLPLRGRGAARAPGRAGRAHASTSWSGAPTCCGRGDLEPPAGAAGLDLSPLLRPRHRARGRRGAPLRGAGPRPRRRLDRALIAEARRRRSRAAGRSCWSATCTTADRTRGRDALGRDRAPLRPRGPAGRRDHRAPARQRRAELRRVRWRAGSTLHLEGQANDYVGKGLSGGRSSLRPLGRRGLRRRRERDRRQHVALRRHRRARRISSGRAGERFAVRNSRRDGRGRGRGRPRLRVHDGRRRGRARHDRAQLRRRHVGRPRLRATTPTASCRARANREMVALGAGRGRGRRCARLVERHLELTGSERARALLERWDEAVGEFVEVLPATTSRRAAPTRRGASGRRMVA